MCTAGEARTRGSCVSSVLCTRVLVCKAQRSERGRGSGEDAAHPGALAVETSFVFARGGWSAFCTAKVKSNSSAESVAPSRLSTGRPTDAVLARSLQHSARNSVCARRCSWTVRTQEAIYLTRIIWYRIATAHVQNHMPANKQKNNERAANYQMRQELRALDHLHEELSAAAQLSVQSSAKPSEKLMGAELASHLVRHNWCVTTRRSTRFMLHVCSPSLWLCCEVSSVRSGAVPTHTMDPANAFTFHGAVGDGRALFGSTRGERPQANKAHLSSVPSPWALPGGRSDACAPAVDLAALMQLTTWIKALGELIRMQDGEDLLSLLICGHASRFGTQLMGAAMV